MAELCVRFCLNFFFRELYPSPTSLPHFLFCDLLTYSALLPPLPSLLIPSFTSTRTHFCLPSFFILTSVLLLSLHHLYHFDPYPLLLPQEQGLFRGGRNNGQATKKREQVRLIKRQVNLLIS